jgi:hypothetical protein
MRIISYPRAAKKKLVLSIRKRIETAAVKRKKLGRINHRLFLKRKFPSRTMVIWESQVNILLHLKKDSEELGHPHKFQQVLDSLQAIDNMFLSIRK